MKSNKKKIHEFLENNRGIFFYYDELFEIMRNHMFHRNKSPKTPLLSFSSYLTTLYDENLIIRVYHNNKFVYGVI